PSLPFPFVFARGRDWTARAGWPKMSFREATAAFPEPVMAKITILPANVSAEVPDGENLIEAGESAGVEMEAGCFNCSCGTCVAEVVSGMENLTEPTPEELEVLDQWNKDPEKFRLTCCNKILKGEVVLRTGH
ncbi:MAG: (2Fe-2S)-binding protein, partial [Verrucomicrobiae bacterium]|nr:(2Fe-2S)-binding protein [Verrucomicrobiae bacterium]